jgi:hypothetical protein
MKLSLDPPAHMLVRCARNGNAAGFGDAFQPRGDVNAVAKDILAFDQDIAEVDANPVEDPLPLGRAFVAGGHLPLHRHGAFDRRDHGREFDEHPVAHRLEDSPAVRGDDRPSGLAPLAHRLGGSGLVLAHHARVADDIGGKDRGELAGGRHDQRTLSARL